MRSRRAVRRAEPQQRHAHADLGVQRRRRWQRQRQQFVHDQRRRCVRAADHCVGRAAGQRRHGRASGNRHQCRRYDQSLCGRQHNTIVGTGTVVAAGGTFDITTTATFADGVHTFVAQETNTPDPNLPESQPFTVEVDPNAPSIATLVGQPVNGGTVELKGTGETAGRHHRSLCRWQHQQDCRHRHGPGRWRLRHHHHGDLHR